MNRLFEDIQSRMSGLRQEYALGECPPCWEVVAQIKASLVALETTNDREVLRRALLRIAAYSALTYDNL